MQRAAVRHFVTVGVDDLSGLYRAQRIGRRYRPAGLVMIVPGAGKGQQLFAIGNGDGTDIQLLMQHLGHLHAVLFVKALTQDPFRRGRHLQRGSGKGGGILFKHGPLVEQDTHKQRSTQGVGDHHRRGNAADQM